MPFGVLEPNIAIQLTKEIDMADCGCGRSPTGNCIGWHKLSEEEYQEKKAAYEARKAEK